jgi:hypothetical protein
MTKEKKPYEVGYGKPPKSGQFKLGESGNRKGRPKGAKNMATVLEEELNTRIEVTEHGKRKKITKRQAVIKQAVNKAVSGDPKFVPIVLSEVRAREGTQSPIPAEQHFTSEDDGKVMESIRARMRQHLGATPEPQSPADISFETFDPSI